MFLIKPPVTPDEFSEYYDLRWRELRAPWDQPRGSEKDEWEASATHITVRDEGGKLLGIGRLHINSSGEAWIRYMATEADCRGQGVGSAVIKALETTALDTGLEYISLNAREHAVPFYEKHGFVVSGDGPTLFGEIRHKLMRKALGGGYVRGEV